ncbi:isopentenyl-diphosphate Delta-isomerase [Longimycelium tulufanense]|uniref:Isopentenyl-diphosphate Delta-isomerase n=1 Tax=Longimycelium tulufanense TaxID=907463 RepID=A0A8J3FTY1_9PSEU|nr:isopentenyl-diphosphate Delta-isomerase [Longimycelium tulufanense]GGM50504.1 isopentenyl-diphosphate Delta-isomerase [Longimycelium tulufanense]
MAEVAGVRTELVVLLDERRQPVGAAEKHRVHGPDTPLHLGFSCYVFDDAANLLVTRRALGKQTWPGVWTNSFCGHPAPSEPLPNAVRRRAQQELGLALRTVELVLPDFSYRATAADGTVENEVCPVFLATSDEQPRPNPDEVVEWRWTPWAEFADLAKRAPWVLSPWAVEQVPLLAEALPD